MADLISLLAGDSVTQLREEIPNSDLSYMTLLLGSTQIQCYKRTGFRRQDFEMVDT